MNSQLEFWKNQGRNFTYFSQNQLNEQIKNELNNHFHDKPSILITGQHHSREHITANIALFSLLKMLHEGIVQMNQEYVNLLLQNKYYVIPSVNVDGVQFIED